MDNVQKAYNKYYSSFLHIFLDSINMSLGDYYLFTKKRDDARSLSQRHGLLMSSRQTWLYDFMFNKNDLTLTQSNTRKNADSIINYWENPNNSVYFKELSVFESGKFNLGQK